MEQRGENEKLIVRYLLGDLPEEEVRRVEDHYFDDDAFFEEMAIVEEELIDDYVSGNLAGRELEQFENLYMASPARRYRVDFSRKVMNSRSGGRESDGPVRRKSGSWFRGLFIGRNLAFQFACAAVALIVAAVAWLAIENARLRNDINRLQAERTTLEQKEKEVAGQVAKERERGDELMASVEREQNERQQLEQQLARLQPHPIAILELSSDTTRSGGAVKSLNIPSGAQTVELKLYTEPNDYETFQVALQTADGGKVWSKGGLKARTTPSGKVVVARLPAKLFSSQDYLLTLSGSARGGDYEDAGIYSFKVAKK